MAVESATLAVESATLAVESARWRSRRTATSGRPSAPTWWRPGPLRRTWPPQCHGLDLDRIEADLADVEVALERLDTGEYWRDEVTGADIPDTVLAERPTARRAST